jgi:hypothetical protein
MYGRERTTDNINEQQREQPRMDDGVEEGTKGDTKVYEHEQTAYIAPLTSNPARWTWKHVILYVRVVPPVVVVVNTWCFKVVFVNLFCLCPSGSLVAQSGIDAHLRYKPN